MPSPNFDVAVIGAGVFGSWAAWHLTRAGARVLLVDAWSPGHSRSSSGGESRIIRMGYGSDEIYTRMAIQSLAQWQALFERTGEPLFHRTGVLWMAREDDPRTTSTRDTLAACGVRTQTLSHRDLDRLYPQMCVRDQNAFAILEPEAGVLMARRAVVAVVNDAIRNGVTYSNHAIHPTSVGDSISAGQYVFACGPWLPKIFPDLLGERIFPTRQEVFFFAPLAGDPRFSSPQLPVWLDFTDPRGPYGFPDLEGRGFKLSFDRHGSAFDPETGDRRITTDGLAAARQFLSERFPDLRDAPLTESRVCQYENTSNGDFLVDRHPEFENFWLLGGGSGHGFKHGPAVGEHIANRILRGSEPEPRFSLVTKATRKDRAVY
jgi:sarcosine oxidase